MDTHWPHAARVREVLLYFRRGQLNEQESWRFQQTFASWSCMSSGGAPTLLAHQCSWWKFPHILKCEVWSYKNIHTVNIRNSGSLSCCLGGASGRLVLQWQALLCRRFFHWSFGSVPQRVSRGAYEKVWGHSVLLTLTRTYSHLSAYRENVCRNIL